MSQEDEHNFMADIGFIKRILDFYETGFIKLVAAGDPLKVIFEELKKEEEKKEVND